MVLVSDGATNFETPHLSLLAPDGELVGRCRSPGLAHGIAGNAAGEFSSPARCSRGSRSCRR